MFKLHDDWRRIIKRAWSIRLLAGAGGLQIAQLAFDGLQTVVPFFEQLIPVTWPARVAYSAVTLGLMGGAFVMRLVSQKQFRSE